jgi:molybdate transport system substrate-binding protein
MMKFTDFDHSRDIPVMQILSHSTGFSRARSGAIGRALLVIAGSLVLLGALVASMVSGPAGPVADGPLIIYCAASNKSVMEAIRQEYQRAYGREIQVQYGASQTLLASLEVSRTGDLYLPADDSYLTVARERDLIAEEFPLARMNAVVAVAKGNPKGIKRFEDLLHPDVRLAQTNPDSAAIGKLTRDVLRAAGKWDALQAHTKVFKTTVNEVANDVKVGAVDAGIVFDAVLHDYSTLEAVAIDELKPAEAHVAVAVLKSCRAPRQALAFARFLSAADKGLVHYREFGFEPVDGDMWSEHPELTLYSGSMLRPAIENTITAFEEREGVRVTRVYNGCGILVGQMRAGHVPDAYFACDMEFMKQVKDLFPESREISQNELVILVKKGNPLGVRSLADLTRSGLRVGIGHEKQCAMGWLTQRTFQESGLQSKLMKNVVTEVPAGDMLVNQMRTGALDAAVAYLSNAAGAGDALDAIRIEGLPCSIAVQPFGVAKDSTNKHTIERLLKAIRARESQERFTREGFRWLDQEAAGS